MILFRRWLGKCEVQACCVRRAQTQGGFIRAEVIAHEDLLDVGSWAAAREAGQLRLEGKDYEMRDGDVVEFRFNV